MGLHIDRLRLGLTSARAETARRAADPRLAGRTYAIPFDDVWRAALALPGDRLRRWEVLQADDNEGVIRMRVQGSGLFRFPSAMTLYIGLDEDGQTRVDVLSESDRAADFGANARRINTFVRALDRSHGAARTRVHQGSADDGVDLAMRSRHRQPAHDR